MSEVRLASRAEPDEARGPSKRPRAKSGEERQLHPEVTAEHRREGGRRGPWKPLRSVPVERTRSPGSEPSGSPTQGARSHGGSEGQIPSSRRSRRDDEGCAGVVAPWAIPTCSWTDEASAEAESGHSGSATKVERSTVGSQTPDARAVESRGHEGRGIGVWAVFALQKPSVGGWPARAGLFGARCRGGLAGRLCESTAARRRVGDGGGSLSRPGKRDDVYAESRRDGLERSSWSLRKRMRCEGWRRRGRGTVRCRLAGRIGRSVGVGPAKVDIPT